LFIFISDLSDDFNRIKIELIRIKEEFLNLFKDNLESNIDLSVLDLLDPITDKIHRNLKPKISLVGFSGVGKTTIIQLIKAAELPIEHIPTITGDVATVKIGRLHFLLWDFAGQEQFSFLWNKFIKGSDAVLIISDSTLENIEKSKFFLELIGEEAPYAHAAVIGNKQDLPNSLNVEDIERIFGIKTYSMVAIDPNNREKMIKIIADILDMNATVSPLLKPIVDRDILMNEAQIALQSGDLKQAAKDFEKIADICIEIGDDSLGKEFYLKSEKLYQYVN
jgi:small GTP-binding protein